MAKIGGSGTIPDFTAADAKSWVDKQGAAIWSMGDVMVIAFGVIGFVIFILGLVQFMRERREAAMGGGSGHQFGLWMLCCGGALGSLDLIYILLVGLAKPPGS